MSVGHFLWCFQTAAKGPLALPDPKNWYKKISWYSHHSLWIQNKHKVQDLYTQLHCECDTTTVQRLNVIMIQVSFASVQYSVRPWRPSLVLVQSKDRDSESNKKTALQRETQTDRSRWAIRQRVSGFWHPVNHMGSHQDKKNRQANKSARCQVADTENSVGETGPKTKG